MKFEDFDKLVEYVVTERIKGVMCQKSAEYARGGDKLYNFKRAAEVSGKTPLECLQGMKLKHDVSILDMLDDEMPDEGQHTREKWEEKIGDDINYLILMLALLYEKHGWKIPGVEMKSDEWRVRQDPFNLQFWYVCDGDSYETTKNWMSNSNGCGHFSTQFEAQAFLDAHNASFEVKLKKDDVKKLCLTCGKNLKSGCLDKDPRPEYKCWGPKK